MSGPGSRGVVPINVRDPFWRDPFFSSTWDEFEKMRQDMMVRSKEFWSNVDTDFVNFDKQVRRAHSDMDRQMDVFRPQLPNWAIPDNLKTELMPFSRANNEVIQVKQDDEKFQVTLDVSDYKPEELKVTTVNDTLVIEGKHAEQREDHKDNPLSSAHGFSSVQKQFSRQWTLPPNVNPNEVVSNLSSDGILLVTAPTRGNAVEGVSGPKAVK